MPPSLGDRGQGAGGRNRLSGRALRDHRRILFLARDDRGKLHPRSRHWPDARSATAAATSMRRSSSTRSPRADIPAFIARMRGLGEAIDVRLLLLLAPVHPRPPLGQPPARLQIGWFAARPVFRIAAANHQFLERLNMPRPIDRATAASAFALMLQRLRHHNVSRWRPPRRSPKRRCPFRQRPPRRRARTIRCSPNGPAPMAASRPGTSITPANSARPSPSRSTSSAARSRRSSTIPPRRPSTTPSSRSKRPGDLLGHVADHLRRSTATICLRHEFAAVREEWDPKLSAASRRNHAQPEIVPAHQGGLRRRATAAGLDAQQLRLVERYYVNYVNNGAALDEAGKARLAAINQRLASMFGDFVKRVVADEGDYHRRHRGGDEGRSRRRPRSRGRKRRKEQGPARRPIRDPQHPLGRRSGPDLRRQSGACARRCGRRSSAAATMATPTTPTR